MRILISGPPAAGKSTLAHQLAEEHDAEVIDFDEIARTMFRSREHHDHPVAVRKATESEVRRRIKNLDRSAVVIRSAPGRWERERWAFEIGADQVILLPVDAAEAKRRAAADKRPWWTASAIDRWWRRFEPSPLDDVPSG